MVTDSRLLTIGEFARASGLTASALRFYADSGLLTPAVVDPGSGYRYYDESRLDRAVTIRELREIGMSLGIIAEVLESGAARAARLIDEHLIGLEQQLQRARTRAAELERTLGPGRDRELTTVSGPMFAMAVEQILAATAREPDHPVLGGVHIEVSTEALTLTATDRYRLSTRTLVAGRRERPEGTDWSATVAGDDLRLAVPELRRGHIVQLTAAPHALVFRAGDAASRSCRILPGTFPDHRVLLDSIGAARTRVVTAHDGLVRGLENIGAQHVLLRIAHGSLTLCEPGSPRRVAPAAVVTGPDIELAFDLTTLYPAIGTAIGPDVMIDITGPDRPIVIRSADDGDLTSLAMPVDPSSIRSADDHDRPDHECHRRGDRTRPSR